MRLDQEWNQDIKPMSENESAPLEEKLPTLSSSVTYGLVSKLFDTLDAKCKASPGRPASETIKALVAKRVSPNSLTKYDTLDPYPTVIMDEATMIMDRILAYPQITRYRKHLNGKSLELSSAWQIHSQSLRVGELYIVLDRTNALLKFLEQLASELGITVNKCQKRFEKKFKIAFKRRLLERHRIVHAHERPSLESRIISLSSDTLALEPKDIEPVLLDMMVKALTGLSQVKKDIGQEVPEILANVEKLHESTSDREAAQMLDLVGKAILKTLGIHPDPSSRPS